jgi:hypothetical protein
MQKALGSLGGALLDGDVMCSSDAVDRIKAVLDASFDSVTMSALTQESCTSSSSKSRFRRMGPRFQSSLSPTTETTTCTKPYWAATVSVNVPASLIFGGASIPFVSLLASLQLSLVWAADRSEVALFFSLGPALGVDSSEAAPTPVPFATLSLATFFGFDSIDQFSSIDSKGLLSGLSSWTFQTIIGSGLFFPNPLIVYPIDIYTTSLGDPKVDPRSGFGITVPIAKPSISGMVETILKTTKKVSFGMSATLSFPLARWP